jgi:hypothetical protein
MIYEKVHFSKFAIDPALYLSKLQQYSPICWPDDWTVVTAKASAHEVKTALEGNTNHQFDIVTSGQIVYVAFEDQTDAVLFKLSITENT